MTFDRYGHLMPNGRDEARERMDAYLSGATGDAVRTLRRDTVGGY